MYPDDRDTLHILFIIFNPFHLINANINADISISIYLSIPVFSQIDKLRKESMRLTSLTATVRLNMFTRRIAHRYNLGKICCCNNNLIVVVIIIIIVVVIIVIVVVIIMSIYQQESEVSPYK
jgi:hypothetical protein